MSNKTVYEDKAEKEEARRKKQREYAEKHTVRCPHCGNPVLDHMTKCPKCKGKLEPVGYQPMSDEKIKKIKLITYAVGIVVAIAVLILVFTLK